MDFLSNICPKELRASLIAQGVEGSDIITVYAIGSTHYAWFKKKDTKQNKNKNLKG